jgi:hypothetical protein
MIMRNLCKICGFHGGDYEEWQHLGRATRRNIPEDSILHEEFNLAEYKGYVLR